MIPQTLEEKKLALEWLRHEIQSTLKSYSPEQRKAMVLFSVYRYRGPRTAILYDILKSCQSKNPERFADAARAVKAPVKENNILTMLETAAELDVQIERGHIYEDVRLGLTLADAAIKWLSLEIKNIAPEQRDSKSARTQRKILNIVTPMIQRDPDVSRKRLVAAVIGAKICKERQAEVHIDCMANDGTISVTWRRRSVMATGTIHENMPA